MTLAQQFDAATLGTFAAAVVVGLGIGTLGAAEPVTIPVVGTVSGLLAGGFALVVGIGLYLGVSHWADGCGCGGVCDC